MIRSATTEDLAEILKHNNAALPAVNELVLDDLVRFLAQAHSFLVIDAPDQSIAGFMIGLPGPGADYDSVNYAWFSERYEAFIYVDRIVVAEAGRGAGIGSQLYAEFAKRGETDGYPVMLAEVNIRPRNDISLVFHEARGFVSVGEQATDGGAKRVTMLEKSLRPVSGV